MTTPTNSLRVLSCVPQQRYTDDLKLAWVDEVAQDHRPDMMVLPQEFHGGIQTLFFADKPDAKKGMKVAYKPQWIEDRYSKLAKRWNMGIAVGALTDCPELNQRRERIYIFDRDGTCTGTADKMILPAYDHVDAKGKTRVFPEVDMNKRALAFDCCGARVSILFCWEVYSSYIWHAISRAQPDFVVSMVKFGVKGWPQKAKKDGESVVTGFGFGGDGGWLERLQMASRWDIAAPIISSTNSWDLPKKCGAIAGQILPFEEHATGGEYPHKERRNTLWVSEGKGNLDSDYVQVDEVDYMYWRYIRDHKFALNAATGEWPSSEAREFTMNWKVKRMERAFVGLPKLMAGKPNVKAVPKDPGLFDL